LLRKHLGRLDLPMNARGTFLPSAALVHMYSVSRDLSFMDLDPRVRLVSSVPNK
jgi:hypothetical protein